MDMVFARHPQGCLHYAVFLRFLLSLSAFHGDWMSTQPKMAACLCMLNVLPIQYLGFQIRRDCAGGS
jgi:hypothetical protein